ncbi:MULTISPECIES: iron-containing alcohol dehydrogenase [Halomonadaceae]|uniref:iron-containing alcohol dehydrogenase n=1 Tax=Halomonadaceae TaxID=28256 RepID=UPI0015839EAB|nr:MULTISPECIES: iron-containing alcohol dehydrogenase [Halomonas]MDI4638116.1 iron-containing alcohol dehydrogenase [Halomonas sp. BMC7]NUJ59118.1 iron-containing alcohol dehydrogenase [Halomonas taeanensis]
MHQDYQTGRQAPVIAGPGCLARLPELRRQHGAERYLLITDAGLEASGLLKPYLAELEQDAEVTRFIAPAGEPSVATVDQAAQAARELQAPLVLGIGGGTALDIAKLVAALTASPGRMDQYLLARSPWLGKAPAVMIPTTSGTGSEVTRTSILADETGRKLWAWGDELLPEAVLLDSRLTRSLPAPLTAATGLDAFVHALEATTGRNRNRLIESQALAAIRLVGAALPEAVQTPNNLEARQQLQEAACLAGMAIDNGGTGIAHNIGHALGSLYHLPHGVAVAIAVEASLAWSIEGHEATFAASAHALMAGSEAKALTELVTELADASAFDQALAPFANLEMDATALAEVMQAEENAPMANNAARIPEGDDWQHLAELTVATFQHRQAGLRAGSTTQERAMA